MHCTLPLLVAVLLLGAHPLVAQDGPLFRVMFDRLPDAERGAIAWGDYDEDGTFDVALTGAAPQRFTGIYRNAGDITYESQSGLVYETTHQYP